MALFPSAPWLQVLPDDTPVDPATDAANAYIRRYASKGVWANVDSWSARIVDVPVSQPKVPVTVDFSADGVADPIPAWGGVRLAMQQLGVPIPAGVQPQTDSDAALVVRVRDELGRVVDMYELWKYRLVDGKPWCSWGGRKVPLNGDTEGSYVTRGYIQNGQLQPYYQTPDMGVTAAGIPLLCGIVTREDLERGYADHPIGVAFPVASSAPHRWPAKRHDASSHPDLPQGARWRLPCDTRVPVGVSRAAACVIRTGRMYGFFHWDTNGGDMPTLRFEEGTTEFFDGKPRYSLGSEVPWGLSVLLPEHYRDPAAP